MSSRVERSRSTIKHAVLSMLQSLPDKQLLEVSRHGHSTTSAAVSVYAQRHHKEECRFQNEVRQRAAQCPPLKHTATGEVHLTPCRHRAHHITPCGHRAHHIWHYLRLTDQISTHERFTEESAASAPHLRMLRRPHLRHCLKGRRAPERARAQS